MKNIDYQLRQFVKVATYKSLSEAAIALNVTQSALSKQLREIELAVGHQVFRRHGRGIELTTQGHALWRAVRAAYKLVDATIGQIRSMHSRAPAKTLRVATLHGRSQMVVNELAATVFGKRPELNLTMMEGSAADVFRLVETGIADVGFVENTSAVPDTLTKSSTVSDRFDLPDCDEAHRAPGAFAHREIPVTPIACVPDIEGDNTRQKNAPARFDADSIVARATIAEIADRTIEPKHSEVASTCRSLVAITRKTQRAA
jgi:DNA-binding transcriptional LysR family regulator